jgi:hypothetical protein
MRDFAIELPHRPGELERISDILSRAGVNLKSVVALAIGTHAMFRFVADDVETARNALRESNIPFQEEEIVTVLLENRAGELAMVAHKLAEAGVNLHAMYVMGVEGDLIDLAIAVDNIKKAKKVFE